MLTYADRLERQIRVAREQVVSECVNRHGHAGACITAASVEQDERVRFLLSLRNLSDDYPGLTGRDGMRYPSSCLWETRTLPTGARIRVHVGT